MAVLPKRSQGPISARKKAGPKFIESPAQPMVELSVPSKLPKVDVLELINRRRRQVIVHSVIYYHYNRNIISDSTFDHWSRELADLQKANPVVAAEAAFAEEFKDFDGCTGMQFAEHPWGLRKALYLLGLDGQKGDD